MPKSNPRGQDRFSTQTELKRRQLEPVGVIGDRSPVEHGGGVIYKGPGDEYELHYFQPYDEDLVSVYRFDIAPDVLAELDWVDWKDIANYIGMDVDELKGYAKSDNVHARASVYESVGGYHGFGELDLDPLESTVTVIDRRYDKDINKAHKAEESRRGNPKGAKNGSKRGNPLRKRYDSDLAEELYDHVLDGEEGDAQLHSPLPTKSAYRFDRRLAILYVDHNEGFVEATRYGRMSELEDAWRIMSQDWPPADHNPKAKTKARRKKNPKGKHIACGKKTSKKDCRQLQHVYESARKRGASKTSASQQAWGSLRENPSQLARRLSRGG